MGARGRRLLFLTQRVPYAPNRGDRLRAWHFLRELAHDFTVDVGTLVHDEDEGRRLQDVPARHVVAGRVPKFTNWGRSVVALGRGTPLTMAMLASPELHAKLQERVEREPPDLVVAFCSSMVPFAMSPKLAGIPLVIDMVDADSAKWASLSETARLPLSWIYRRESVVLGAFEREAMTRARMTYCVNEKEATVLRTLAPDARVEVVANGVSLERFAPKGPPSDALNVVFCGVMDYAPNVEGVLWFAKEVWPQIRARLPGATFTIVGASPTRAVTALAQEADGISVTGRVEDVGVYLWRAGVAVAPLLTARGVQNKVLEAVAAGLPCVVTAQVSAGLPPEVVPACPEAQTSEEFAIAVCRLLALSAAKRRETAQLAEIESLSWASRGGELRGLLHEALQLGHRRPSPSWNSRTPLP